MNPNDLPYQCSKCLKKFHDMDDLKRHQLSHRPTADKDNVETSSTIIGSHDNNISVTSDHSLLVNAIQADCSGLLIFKKQARN